jgi:hypothetical protein
MTTSYAVSTNIGSVSFNNYVNAPITGPLSTNQTPCQIPYHSYGFLSGVRPTPPQFYPQQAPLASDMNTNARQQYLRTRVNKTVLAEQIRKGKMSNPIDYVIHSSWRQVPVSSHTNYIPPIDSSLYVNIKKSDAVGQTAYKVNLPNDALTGTKSYYPSGTRSSIRRVRSGGSVAPKKKGAIENNTSTNGRICGWGSIVRQNY